MPKRKRAGDARRRVKRQESPRGEGRSIARNPFARARAAWDELVELARGRVRAAEATAESTRELGRAFDPADWFQRFGEDAPRRDIERASPRLAGELADTLEHACGRVLSRLKETPAA